MCYEMFLYIIISNKTFKGGLWNIRGFQKNALVAILKVPLRNNI